MHRLVRPCPEESAYGGGIAEESVEVKQVPVVETGIGPHRPPLLSVHREQQPQDSHLTGFNGRVQRNGQPHIASDRPFPSSVDQNPKHAHEA